MSTRIDKQVVMERAIEEAIAFAMDTELRDPILRGVERRKEMPVEESKRMPVAAALLAASFVGGYLLGRRAAKR